MLAPAGGYVKFSVGTSKMLALALRVMLSFIVDTSKMLAPAGLARE
jgi:hypothetical protein